MAMATTTATTVIILLRIMVTMGEDGLAVETGAVDIAVATAAVMEGEEEEEEEMVAAGVDVKCDQ